MISLETVDNVLRYFELMKRDGIMVPKKYGAIPLSSKGVEAMAALKEFAKEHKKPSVRVILPESEAYVFSTLIHTTEKARFAYAIEGIFDSHCPIHLADAIYDFNVVRFDPVRGGTFVSVSVLPRKSVDAYSHLLKSVNIKPASFTTESHALARALFSPKATGVHAVLSIGPRHSVAFIVDSGVVCMSSYIPVGSADIRASATKEGNHGTPFERSLSAFSVIRDGLEALVSRWKDQGKKGVHYSTVSSIVLCGSDSLTPGFSKYVSQRFKAPVKIGSVWTNLPFENGEVPDLHRKDSLDYGASIGALL